jgi:hypothetical protein
VSITDATLDEVVDSLTGHDENNIYAAAGASLDVLLTERKLTAVRAVVAVHLTREGSDNFRTSWRRAMDMPLSEVNGYFAEPAEDVDPEQPDSPLA